MLILSKIAKNLFSFPPFFILPFMFLTLALMNNSYKYSNSSVGKYRTNPKNTILLTLASVNISQKMNLKKKFSMSFFSCSSFIIVAMSRLHKLITLAENTQDSIEQARGRSHEEVSSQIFMLYIM